MNWPDSNARRSSASSSTRSPCTIATTFDRFLRLAEQTDLPPRELATQRRREVDTLLRLASAQAVEAGTPEPNRTQLAEVESTFSAALVDPDVADLVRSARVLKGFSYGGFGSLGGGFAGETPDSRTRAGALGRDSAGSPGGASRGDGSRGGTPHGDGSASGGGSSRPAAGSSSRAERAVTEAAEAAEAARVARVTAQTRLEAAQAALADAQAVEADHASGIERLTAEIAERRERLDEVSRAARAARQTRLQAERDLASAQRRVARLGGSS